MPWRAATDQSLWRALAPGANHAGDLPNGGTREAHPQRYQGEGAGAKDPRAEGSHREGDHDREHYGDENTNATLATTTRIRVSSLRSGGLVLSRGAAA